MPETYKIIKPDSLIFEFTLNDRLLKKWKMAINESIPLFLHNSESVENGNFYVCLEKTGLKFGNVLYRQKLVMPNPQKLLNCQTVEKSLKC
ncbi:unnamed protein product [Meloidogyne enterolobii]|uniref:Uncharacterized protein n=1 Tax=Meloidogyne enterolobii TaxID=390850 RepID=A0ACB0ZJF1_MELEN